MPKDQLIRMALRIRRQLSRPPHAPSFEWDKAVRELLYRAGIVQQQFGLVQTAAQRGWHAAAILKRQYALSDLQLLENAIEQSRRQHPASVASTGPTLRTVVEELRQLKDEFDEFEIDLKQGLVSVTSEPVELEGIHLGSFSIELHISRLADRLNADCFTLIALEPNPAASSSETTHPHVQDKRLCAGEASVPVSIALKEGRIADAFLLIRSVLTSYNEDSPYVSLESWKGLNCQDCGYTTDSDSLYYCEHCEHDVCEGCSFSCDICGGGCCRGCLEKDPVSENRCCTGCRECCAACNRTVDSESFDRESDLCPECLEKHNSSQEQENQDELAQCSTDNNATNTPAQSIPPAPMPAAA